ncbi:hypothetical protein THRCLA_11169 [Thraustotheca clavata]|uniref:NACHT domain-containing protein n=1 Tax=Thraustotheca clavata TaxID=74557 RepID=A0A1V9Y8L7_9STRA|nr:hypothetical protein THRCLA_11169 [Thraustotheca clavata]
MQAILPDTASQASHRWKSLITEYTFKEKRLTITVATELSESEYKLSSKFLAITGGPGGVWKIVNVNGTTIACRSILPRHDNIDSLHADKLFEWDVIPKSVENECSNPTIRRKGTEPCSGFLLQPLIFHCRTTIYNIYRIETVGQTFDGDVFFELRLRLIALRHVPQEWVEELTSIVGISAKTIDCLNIVSRDGEPHHWTGYSPSTTCAEHQDFSFKVRLRGSFSEQFELTNFPFDQQELHVSWTVNQSSQLVELRVNDNFPSLFLLNNFQQGNVFRVVTSETVIATIGRSDASESSSGSIYYHCNTSIVLQRKPGYHLSNIAIPMALLSSLGFLSFATEEKRIGTAERLLISLTLVLTVVAYKFAVAGAIPQIPYMTTLDRHTTFCFVFLCGIAVENAVLPAICEEDCYDQENEVLIALIVLFTCGNIWFAVNIIKAAQAQEKKNKAFLEYHHLQLLVGQKYAQISDALRSRMLSELSTAMNIPPPQSIVRKHNGLHASKQPVFTPEQKQQCYAYLKEIAQRLHYVVALINCDLKLKASMVGHSSTRTGGMSSSTSALMSLAPSPVTKTKKEQTVILLPKELRSSDEAQRVESATVLRENAAHEAFSKSRTEGFAYVNTIQYMQILESHCCFEFEPSSPIMVVTGHPASGKSSLLINWVQQRLKKPPANAEVIFQHYCGCSYESVKLSVFLFRLMFHLKAAFSLRDFELPNEHEEEKLKFSLARCLEGAVGHRATNQNGKRKNIIIVLDGVDNLRTEDGGESLSWLPNNLPPGVRILMSATKPSKNTQLASSRWIVRKEYSYDSDEDLIFDSTMPPVPTDTHTIKELRRRNAGFLTVEPLDERMCLKLIQSNTVIENEVIQKFLDARGSSSPLYLRFILHLYDQSNAKNDFLREILNIYDFPTLYEFIMQQWRTILLADVQEAYDMAVAKCQRNNASMPNLDSSSESRKRSSRKESEPFALAQMQQAQVTIDEEEIQKARTALERRALLARHALSLFTVARFGLSEKDFHHLLEDAAPRAIRVLLFQLLSPHLMAIHRRDCDVVLYDISHNQLRLLARYGFLRDDTLRQGYHKTIATYFEKMPATQRRIDELPVQLECCNLWSQLQTCLVDMKMFQLWWNERNRQDFLAYWRALRSYFSMHDPVDDYIRSLDDYIEFEGPSTEELLSLFLTITEFLRTWQKTDETKVIMHRPDPPQLKEFINSQGTFSLSHLNDTESKQIQGIVDYLCPHEADDGYYVRRWLWTQFPLIAVSFENLFLKKFSQDAENDPSLDAGDSIQSSLGSSLPSQLSLDSLIRKENKASNSTTSNHKTTLPKSVVCNERKRVITRHSPKKKSMAMLEYLNPYDTGAFEFVEAHANTNINLSIPALKEQLRELRSRHDKLKFISKERSDALAILEAKLTDAKANSSHQSHNSLLRDSLTESIRLALLDSMHGRQKSDYYKTILRECESNPARDPNIIESSEGNVRKMKQDITDLQQKAQVIGYECRLASIEVPKLTTAIQEKLQIHQLALSRLRWRHLQIVRQMEWESKFRLKSKEMKKQAEGDLSTEEEAVMLHQLKEKEVHMQETSTIRVKNVQDLKMYKGSNFMDDGVLGMLRHVGINEADQVLLRWHDQFEHAAQLEAEKTQAELHVQEYQQRLESVRIEFQNLKLGQTTNAKGKGGNGDTENSTSGKVGGIKHLELQLSQATSVSQHKKQRAQRLKALSENLHLGLLHLAQMLKVKVNHGMDTAMLVDAVEQNVRSLIGDDSASSGPASLRKKASLRNGVVATPINELRSTEERQKYNIRVRNAPSPHRLLAYLDEQPTDTESIRSDNSSGDEALDEQIDENVLERSVIKADAINEVQKRTQHSGDKRLNRKKKIALN